MTASPAESRNLLLMLMTGPDRARIAARAERTTLKQGDVIAEAGGEIGTVCFLESGIASYSDVSNHGVRSGIGMVGYEGLVEWHSLLGSAVSPCEVTIAVGPALAWRMPAQDLLDAAQASAPLHDLLMRFVQTFVIQLGRTAASNLCDPVEQRLSRWLLMNHDRLPGDDIELTHEQIGVMLGVRRASVTEKLHILEGEGLIRSKRGRITIRDRARLRACAGDSYGVAEAAYNRLVTGFGKDR